MSHPWKAQSYYLYHDPRTTGSVPAPLGNSGVREALAGYTRGSFAAKSPWNVPKYVATEPTGVDGFGAFGQTEDCLPRAEVEALIKAGVKAGLDQVGSFSVFGQQISAAPLAGPISSFIMQRVVSLSQKGTDVQGAMRGLVTDAIASATGLPSSLISVGANELTSALVNVPRICAAPTAPAGLTLEQRLGNCRQAKALMNDPDPMLKTMAERQWDVNNCGEIMPDPIQLSPEEFRALQQRATQRTTTIARLTQPITALRAIPPSAPAAKGAVPIMLGAAAIAALFLLK